MVAVRDCRVSDVRCQGCVWCLGLSAIRGCSVLDVRRYDLSAVRSDGESEVSCQMVWWVMCYLSEGVSS